MESDLNEIEKSVLIVNEIKTLLIRNFDQSIKHPEALPHDEYIVGYRHGFMDSLTLIKNIINTY